MEGIVDELIDRKSEWDTKPTLLPVETDEYWISSGYGWRKSPFTGRREFHSGLDIASRRGTPVIAPADGKVISIGNEADFLAFSLVGSTKLHLPRNIADITLRPTSEREDGAL